MAETKIVVGPQPFSVGEEYPWLAERDEDGAVVTFTGKVRNHNLGDSVKALTLEHYPGMTEKALAEIVDEARNRWPLGRVTVIHRIGELWPGDEIVFVGVTSAHRSSAFEAGQLLWIISKPAHRSGSAKPRRKATAGLKLGRAISRRQNAGSFLLAG
ncbi:molybdopterin converting factor subunit 2 [Escherichia coli]|uniref:Molybdopterin synthase catalytic subunit n=1 Tax=Escherichia coli TaxID=562 RepID=A0A376RLU6_ECOLX|nr:molybdopterin converting factor subunit 2 [Escherichia coli]